MKATIAVLCFLVLVAYVIAAVDAKRSPGERCTLPKKTGPCKASFSRFYFDNKDGQCKSFTYGGCGGNGNNFKTLKKCQRTCK
uniref:Putative secreted protease inhibitor ISL1156_cluster318 n=1 Tax=Ixodes scapularis TaxID=6945 RepID=Q8MVB4_IXOSC|nr:putative secreted protease inhibitor ISL1156_cluster318 [Ixodes scapularis]